MRATFFKLDNYLLIVKTFNHPGDQRTIEAAQEEAGHWQGAEGALRGELREWREGGWWSNHWSMWSGIKSSIFWD